MSDLGFSKRIQVSSSVLHSFVRAHGSTLIQCTCLVDLAKTFDLGA